MSMVLNDDSVQILEVWSENLEAEMTLIREVVKDFPFVAIDTAFPGIASPPPLGNFETTEGYNYATLRTNVNLLNMIQLGLTFSDEKGNLPTFGPDNNKHRVWQFNFREFDPSSGDFDPDSIELLRQAGIDFEENNRNGVDSRRFAELLMSSGVVMNGNVRWVMFHGAYDFGYLLKLLSARDLPETLEGFFEMIRVYFPRFCDAKHLAKFCDGFRGGLNKLAEVLGVERIGICHQAGSDSLLTSRAFMMLHQDWFNGSTDKYTGVLFGYGAVNGQ